MKLSELKELPEYFDRYIKKCDDVEIIHAMQTSIDELNEIPLDEWKKIGNKTYEPGKWNIKDILQHLIDTERIFSYRALVFARGDGQRVPSFPEDDYAAAANAGERTLEDLISELRSTHESAKILFQSFSEEVLLRTGEGFKGPYSVASIGFIMPGHQRWHFDVIKEKYLTLV